MNKSSGGFSQYLKYALGEIILVVVGILIALYIKGWYQAEEKQDDLKLIGEQVINDLRRDTSGVNNIIRSYEPVHKDYLAIINKRYNLDSLKVCNNCGYLISNIAPFVPSQNGYNLLKDWKSSYESEQDSLIHDTQLFYEEAIPWLELIVEMLKDDVKGNLTDWRDHQDWYAHWVMGVSTDSFYEYMANDPIYRNKVANFYLLLYRNYLQALRSYNAEAIELADRWEKEIGD